MAGEKQRNENRRKIELGRAKWQYLLNNSQFGSVQSTKDSKPTEVQTAYVVPFKVSTNTHRVTIISNLDELDKSAPIPVEQPTHLAIRLTSVRDGASKYR